MLKIMAKKISQFYAEFFRISKPMALYVLLKGRKTVQNCRLLILLGAFSVSTHSSGI